MRGLSVRARTTITVVAAAAVLVLAAAVATFLVLRGTLTVAPGGGAAGQDAAATALAGSGVPLLGIAGGLLLATCLLAWLAVRLALRPVAVMVRLASRASATGDLPVPPGRDEVSSLATTLNAALARTRAAVTRQRAFIEDASRELRTPLEALRGEVELARTSVTYDDLQESLASAAHEVRRLSDLTDDLLLVARESAAADDLAGSSVEPAGSTLRPTDLRALVPGELRRLGALVPRTSLSLDDSGVGGVTALAAGPDSAWARVLANLVRSAGSAGAGEVVVRLTTTATEVHLVVDDDGPGFTEGSPGEEQAGLDRLREGQEERAGRGNGLGMAIVDALVRARRGSVVLAAGDGGGGRVSVTVPLARALAEADDPATDALRT